MNWFLISGAVLSFIGVIFHGFIGGKIYKTNIFFLIAFLMDFGLILISKNLPFGTPGAFQNDVEKRVEF